MLLGIDTDWITFASCLTDRSDSRRVLERLVELGFDSYVEDRLLCFSIGIKYQSAMKVLSSSPKGLIRNQTVYDHYLVDEEEFIRLAVLFSETYKPKQIKLCTMEDL